MQQRKILVTEVDTVAFGMSSLGLTQLRLECAFIVDFPSLAASEGCKLTLLLVQEFRLLEELLVQPASW